jgi:hypothetical protein
MAEEGRENSRRQREESPASLHDQNYVYVTQSMPDMVTMIKSTMKHEYPDSLLYAVLYGFANKAVKVDDLNRPGKKVSVKVLSYQEMMKRSSSTGGGGYGSFRGMSRRQGAWFLSTMAPFQHFPDIQIENDLKEFMQYDATTPATFITLLPYENKPGYLSILKTIDVDNVPGKPFTRINPLPHSESYNATVHNRMPADPLEATYQVRMSSSLGMHVVDDNLDILAFSRHYESCGLMTTTDMRFVHYFLKTPAKMASESLAYRKKYAGRFASYPIIETYPKQKVEEVKENQKIGNIHKKKTDEYRNGTISSKEYHSQMSGMSLSRVMMADIRPHGTPDGFTEEDLEILRRLPPRDRVTEYTPSRIEGSSTDVVSHRSLGNGLFDSVIDQSMDAADELTRSAGSDEDLHGVVHDSISISHLPAPNVATDHGSRRMSQARGEGISICGNTFTSRFSGSRGRKRGANGTANGTTNGRSVRQRSSPLASFGSIGRTRRFGV